jgi:hypothetical protein
MLEMKAWRIPVFVEHLHELRDLLHLFGWQVRQRLKKSERHLQHVGLPCERRKATTLHFTPREQETTFASWRIGVPPPILEPSWQPWLWFMPVSVNLFKIGRGPSAGGPTSAQRRAGGVRPLALGLTQK